MQPGMVKMDGELLVRTYNVGFGDCIFVRIPDGDDAFHMLIDCGTCNSMRLLRRALEDMRTLLPDEPTEDGSTPQKRLDLLVVTHPHEDHICGLIPDWFKDIRIGQIWLSAFIKEDHPQARKSREVMALVDSMVYGFQNSSGSLADEDVLREMLAVSLSNHDVLNALRGTAEGPNPNFPPDTQRLYVFREPEGSDGAAYLEQLAACGLVLEDGSLCYRSFQEPLPRFGCSPLNGTSMVGTWAEKRRRCVQCWPACDPSKTMPRRLRLHRPGAR